VEMETRRTRLLAVASFLIPLAVYILPHRYHGSGDSIPAELVPITILHGHGLNLNEFTSPNEDLPYYLHNSHGHIISSYPVIPALLNMPAYSIASLFRVDLYKNRFQLSLVTAATLVSFSVLFLFLTLRELSGDPLHAFWFALLYAFGTNAWSTAGIAIFQHGPSLFFLTGAIYCLVRSGGSTTPLAGLFLGFAVWNRPTNIVFALSLAVYVLVHRRRFFLMFAALAAIPAVLLAVFSQIYWGSVRALGQGQGGWGFNGRVLGGLAGLLVSPSRGLLIFTPLFVFGVVEGIRRTRRDSVDPLLTYLFTSCVLLIAIYTKWGVWWGGHSFSYRLITEVSPALILLAAEAWRAWVRGHSISRRLFYAAAALSVVVQTIGVWPYPTLFNQGIDTEPSRLWSWKEGELAIGVSKVLVRYHLRRHEIRVHHPGNEQVGAPFSGARYHVWWTLANNDDNIPGWCDAPVDQQVVKGPVLVYGWAKSAMGEVDVRVILDEGRKVAIPDRYPRADVAKALPQLGDVSRAGWKVWFLFPPGEPVDHEVTIEFRAPNGHVRFLPPLHFRWEAKPSK
jgi:hypothetical protein